MSAVGRELTCRHSAKSGQSHMWCVIEIDLELGVNLGMASFIDL